MNMGKKINPHSPRTSILWSCIGGLVITAMNATAQAQTCQYPWSWNGYCPETTTRVDEQRIHNFVFKASHNSYDRSETLAEQVDDYNCWMLELDCWWLDNNIYVRHLCGGGNGDTLTSQLIDIDDAATARDRVTFIYMEMKYDCTNDNWECGLGETCHEWPADHRSQFQSRIELTFPPEEIYTADEWDAIDGKSWPSYQELLRRGKHFVFILDERGAPDGGDSFFFEIGALGGYNTLVNVDAGCDGGEHPDPVTPTDRTLYRAYPGSWCAGLCNEQNGGYWEDGVTLGFNFVATNCVSDSHTFDMRTHSPHPIFVAGIPTGRNQWGTHGSPFYGSIGILFALNRATTPAVDILLQAGIYDWGPGEHTLSGRGTLKPNSGTVTLQ